MMCNEFRRFLIDFSKRSPAAKLNNANAIDPEAFAFTRILRVKFIGDIGLFSEAIIAEVRYVWVCAEFWEFLSDMSEWVRYNTGEKQKHVYIGFLIPIFRFRSQTKREVIFFCKVMNAEELGMLSVVLL